MINYEELRATKLRWLIFGIIAVRGTLSPCPATRDGARVYRKKRRPRGRHDNESSFLMRFRAGEFIENQFRNSWLCCRRCGARGEVRAATAAASEAASSSITAKNDIMENSTSSCVHRRSFHRLPSRSYLKHWNAADRNLSKDIFWNINPVSPGRTLSEIYLGLICELPNAIWMCNSPSILHEGAWGGSLNNLFAWQDFRCGANMLEGFLAETKRELATLPKHAGISEPTWDRNYNELCFKGFSIDFLSLANFDESSKRKKRRKEDAALAEGFEEEISAPDATARKPTSPPPENDKRDAFYRKNSFSLRMRSHHSRLGMCFDTHFRKLRGYCDKFAENVICVCPAYQITSHKSKARERGSDKLDMRMRQRAHEKGKHNICWNICGCDVVCTEFCELHVNFVFFVWFKSLSARCVWKAGPATAFPHLSNNLFGTFPCACRIFNYDDGKTNFSKLYSRESGAAHARSFLGHVWWRQWDLLELAGSVANAEAKCFRVLDKNSGTHSDVTWPSTITEVNTVRCLIEQGAINCPSLS